MDTKALRQKILDLAIRGKLVPQDPNDEPAEVLLERIREQKQQMLKEGKLKKKDIKNDTIIFKGEDNLHYEKFQDGTVKCIEDEIPFEVPEGWAWARFLAITINRDSERKPISASQRTDVEKIYDYYGASGKIDKIDKYIFDEKLLLIGEDGANLVTRSKPIAFFAEGKYWVNNHAHCIDSPDKSILQFICFFINAINLEKYVTGSAQPKMTQDNMNSILVALPPYKEQQLISQQLDIIWASIDKIEFEKENVLKLVDNAKSKILDLAIRGKLVSQDSNNEPASVLLERIRAEKEELIKQGKIKRDKKESVIFKGDDNSYYERVGDIISNIDDEIPFEVPQNWEWSRLQTICYPITDGTHKTPTYSDSGYIFLSAKNITTGKINWNDIMYIPKSLHDELYSRVSPKMNDILLAKNGTTGVAAIVDRECEFDIYVTLALLRVINNNISSQYLLKIIASNTIQDYFKSSLKGIGVPNLHLEHIRTTLIPIPPINEQNKIVEKIYQYYSLLDSIVQNIE
ncbi:restriction endonuclease subunit S [Lachnospira eligens]|jgi:type I restriction enzyme S subunit|uniref:Restriction endonuclease subunit S n=1 Tax=Lachnospira eligens TaxID=39485 RepID=A0A415MF25_9FIRM|nr:restriction endonuclease subunit S [Lachnospira eligens]RHA51470.1 restriction endonuclease subunit S [Lachnospira eligens]RHK45555.1 restriction endonuclease subunit S [Lachnospira eligens]RHL72349.1 restriction endonuclease subunit S [Lachnospira eligens]